MSKLLLTPSIEWKGRNDSGQRVWKNVRPYQSHISLNNTIGLIGFSCDQGVHNNNGRTGAAAGPKSFRQSLANKALHFSRNIYDLGDVVYTPQSQLLKVQEQLALAVSLVLEKEGIPFVIGGGHELAYGHFLGLKMANKHKNLGIINIDAHLDMRALETPQGSSGTPFLQICNEYSKKEEFNYFVVSTQRSANTDSLFETAKDCNVQSLDATDMLLEKAYYEKLDHFIETVDNIWVSLCLDSVSSAFAPGVSAPNPLGIFPHHVLKILDCVKQSNKLISFDIAELNPKYDRDQQTASLAGEFFLRMFGN